MKAQASVADQTYCQQFQRCEVDPATFHHREHVRLAYTLLTQYPLPEASEHLKTAILNFLTHVGAPPSKYHETLTYGWLWLVQQAMQGSNTLDAEAFLAANPALLNKDLIYDYYSKALLESDAARQNVVAADLT